MTHVTGDHPRRRTRRRPAPRSRAAAVAAVVIGTKSPWTFVDVTGLAAPEPDRLAALLEDGRVCVSAAPWFKGSVEKAMAQVHEYDGPLAWMKYRGALLVEARFVSFGPTTSSPPWSVHDVEAAVRAAVDRRRGSRPH